MRYCYYGKKIVEHLDVWEYDEGNPEVVFSFGGDGTMLGAIHKYNDIENVMFVGIKEGNLGFFCGFMASDLNKIVKQIESKKYEASKFTLLQYKVITKNQTITGFAVNEIAITNPIHTQIIDVFIDEEHLETFRGTGLLVSPPAGSTAYNKSLGGSIVAPNIKAYQLTEIASINNNAYKTLSSSLLLSDAQQLKLKMQESKNIYLSVDGNHLDVVDVISIELGLANKEVTILFDRGTFFTRLKKSFL